ncbi:uncharacterized protein N0V89_011692 [Didymosphaeria variabile]|uniref:Uncharacterized protein n=1 Tax=Didymosphaeria variabile TaxID=1932322 RepID=A0A9W9C5Z3_9PLEO|nr:uncharacterized protein N0V89_011692 [Didymosphaeria variabile]KAJ4345559.1 hypothetical protein N0V89_011692 [Didymosphaeria variabile]
MTSTTTFKVSADSPASISSIKIKTAAMTEAITIRNQLASPLLRLPGEIRNKIYAYTFPGTVLSVVPYFGKLKDPKGGYYLLFTCRQILVEAKEVCMDNLVLQLPPLKHMFAFRKTVSASTVEPIRRIMVSAKLARFMVLAPDHRNALQVIGSRLASLEVVEVCDIFLRSGYERTVLAKYLLKAIGNPLVQVKFILCDGCKGRNLTSSET